MQYNFQDLFDTSNFLLAQTYFAENVVNVQTF